jgi:hypothetical protein
MISSTVPANVDIPRTIKRQLETELRVLSPRANCTDRAIAACKLTPTFEDRECHVARVADPYGRNLGFLDRSRYFFFEVAPRLYSRG